MNEKTMLKKRIHAYDFAIHETVLFLDTHPHDPKALHMLREYRRRRQEEVAKYEARFGKYIVTPCDVPAENFWEWVDSPWPWERQV